MRQPILILSMAVLAGCGRFDPLDILFGPTRTTVILSPGSLEVSAKPQTLRPSSVAEVLGKDSVVCIGLESNAVDPRNAGQALDRFAQVQMLAVVHSNNGKTYEFKRPSIMFEDDALSACVGPDRSTTIPKGAKIDSLVLSSAQPVHGTRALWFSREAIGD